MTCDGSSEKYISVVFEKLSSTSSDQTSSQTKNDSEYPPPVQRQILSAIQKISESKNCCVKAITKKLNKTSGTSFDEGCIAVNKSQLLYKKITTNVKTPLHLDSFCISTTEITLVEEIVLDDTHFIRNLLDDIINNA